MSSTTKVTHFLSIGPGGRRCVCCFPAPGSKNRKAQYRSAKRKSNTEVKRELRAELITPKKDYFYYYNV